MKNHLVKIWTFNLTGLGKSAGQYIAANNALPPYRITNSSRFNITEGYQGPFFCNALWYPAGSIFVVKAPYTSAGLESGQLGIGTSSEIPGLLTDYSVTDSGPSKLNDGQVLLLRINTMYKKSFSKQYDQPGVYNISVSFLCNDEVYSAFKQIGVKGNISVVK